jgi:hypothetical protein
VFSKYVQDLPFSQEGKEHQSKIDAFEDLELQLLQALSYNLSPPTPRYFLKKLLCCIKADQNVTMLTNVSDSLYTSNSI